ncbi:hypothetical protein ABZZ20_31405 [Streptomyces sp. NPDC006430]
MQQSDSSSSADRPLLFMVAMQLVVISGLLGELRHVQGNEGVTGAR